MLLNKWELLDDAEQRAEVTLDIERKLHFIGRAPMLKISALTGKGVHKLLPALSASIDDYQKRVPTRKVNEVVMTAQAGHAGAARWPHPLRHAGCHRPADVHALRQQGDLAVVPAVHRAAPARGVRLRGDADQAPSAAAFVVRTDRSRFDS